MPVRTIRPARATLPALILAIGLVGCSREAPDPRGLLAGETLLTVSGTGRPEAVPDQALFTAGLSSIAPSAEAASARNGATMNRITAALAKLNVPARDIQTRNLSLARIDYGRSRSQFEASNSVAVRVRDVSKVGAAIAAATAANILSGPDLTVTNPEKANLGAYGVAYKAARAKAESYAGAAGLRIVRVLSIRDGGDGGTMAPMGQAERRADMAFSSEPAAPPVMAGTNANVVTTSVDFVLAPR
ncbi:hypothetical protein C8J45_11343 [Sphingomonas sp. PP-CE-3G-477]|uniref:SIMPL domain-containing protein n=1 Tax=Sphingomonas sp. PP-CE-3G-477 TaxID=2135660 RepID=UPI000D3C23B1|nr:SIMPL domain-containing protein [Sphingomonas sp. PP-CE-3G-477]PTQ60092.1 hypothetical protein C8J45_11343 [Sphingomonas sp. PP-CE-3G-477]